MSGFKMFWVIVLAIVGGCSLLAVGNVALDSGGFGGWIVLGGIVGFACLMGRLRRRDAAQAAKFREKQAAKAAKVRRLELDPEWRAHQIETLKRELGEPIAGAWGSASAPR